MTSDTRGPQPGKVPPHVRERLERKRAQAEERRRKGPPYRRWWAIAAYVAAALLIGLGAGLSLRPDPLADALDVVRGEVLPVGFQADSAWTLGTGGNPAISEGLTSLTTQNDPAVVQQNSQAWLDAYDEAVTTLTGLRDLPAPAAAITGLLSQFVQTSRDAVEVLAVAADEEGDLRATLLTEVRRLRGRAQALLQEARAAVRRLEVEVLGEPVTPGPDTVVPPSQEPLRPTPAPSPAAGATPDGEPSPAPQAPGTPAPSPT